MLTLTEYIYAYYTRCMAVSKTCLSCSGVDQAAGLIFDVKFCCMTLNVTAAKIFTLQTSCKTCYMTTKFAGVASVSVLTNGQGACWPCQCSIPGYDCWSQHARRASLACQPLYELSLTVTVKSNWPRCILLPKQPE